jgi:hypothetical protein
MNVNGTKFIVEYMIESEKMVCLESYTLAFLLYKE